MPGMTTLTGGEALAQQLQLEGVTQVFGVPGIQLDWATDGIAKLEGAIRFRTMRHEQAASYAADGYARSAGEPGVCMVVPGPGMYNAMAGLATAYACSSPVLAIIGQINSKAIGKGYGILHELPDQSSALDNVTKWHAMARRPQDIPGLVREAFHRLRSGRPRPVAIEVPPDVLQAKAETALCPPGAAEGDRVAPDLREIEAAAALLRGARRIGIFAGWGVTAAGANAELQQLAERLQAPVVMSGNGRGSISDRHPLALPQLGARALFPACDVVLVVGSRMLDSGGRPAFSNVDAVKFVHVNVEPNDWSPPRNPAATVHADAKLALRALHDALDGLPARASAAADAAKVRAWCEAQFTDVQPQYGLVKALRAAIPDDGVLVGEMTQVSYVARVAYPCYAPRTFLTPGYQGTLGYGYPTALGAAAANPGKAVVSINGDGGFGFALQELATARMHNFPVVAVVFNDGAFGNVKRFHQDLFGRSLGADLVNPDFVKLAEAFGVQAERVHTADALAAAVRSAIASGAPALIEMPVSEMPSPLHLSSEAYRGPRPAPPNPLEAAQAAGTG